MTYTVGNRIHILLALCATIGVIPARHTNNNNIAGPGGLSLSDWQQIRALYEKHRHTAVLVEGEYRARNPRQQWLTRFDGRGFRLTPDEGGWSWGLEVRGEGDHATVTAKDERVVYRWNSRVEEWFVNGTRGLEHGFTVRSRKAGEAGRLRLRLGIRGGLPVRVESDGRGARFGDRVKYEGLTAWDADGRTLAARMEATGDELTIEVDDHDARYPVTIDPVVQQAYLKASNTGAGDEFGGAVAVSGDTVVVAAVTEDSAATGVNGNQADNSALNSGAAYVFTRSGAVWSQQAYLKASNTGSNDQFGISVAISGETIIVGAWTEDSAATGVNGNQTDNSRPDGGAAYVFTRAGAVWSQQAYLKASDTGSDDRFGYSVAVSGDTIVVGADQEDSNATGVNGNHADNTALNSGAAYVFTRVNSAWSQQAYLKASNTDARDAFGESVAISGDTIVVGAYSEDSDAMGVNGNQSSNALPQSGAAYVFIRTSGAWSQQAYLKASNTGENDSFGASVAISGDTVVVGAYLEDSSGTGVNGNQANDNALDSGAAYVFVRTNGVWSQLAYLKASNTGASDRFGSGVTGTGVTVSRDSAVVGAPVEASNATGIDGNQGNNSLNLAGAAYAFTLDRGFTYAGIFRFGFYWIQDVNGDRSFNTPPDRAFAFGGVAGDIPITGDWNGDGHDKAGIYRPANGLFILDYDGDLQLTAADKVYNFGVGVQPGDVPVIGDWTGTGTAKIGLFRQGFFWILDIDGNGVFEQAADRSFAFGGVAGDVPVVGDWNGNGTTDVGLFRAGFFWILDANENRQIDQVNQANGDRAFPFGGIAGDVPLVGRWATGDAKSKVGVFRAGFFWVLDADGNGSFDGAGPGPDLAFPFGGLPNDKPVVGRW